MFGRRGTNSAIRLCQDKLNKNTKITYIQPTYKKSHLVLRRVEFEVSQRPGL